MIESACAVPLFSCCTERLAMQAWNDVNAVRFVGQYMFVCCVDEGLEVPDIVLRHPPEPLFFVISFTVQCHNANARGLSHAVTLASKGCT